MGRQRPSKRKSITHPHPTGRGGPTVTTEQPDTDFATQFAELRRLGLSEYASRAYLALLDLGETDARSVSRLAKVPAAKIYQTLDHLNERGLVEVIPDSPRRYVPMPITRYLRRMRSDHESAIKELRNREPGLADLFPLKGDREMSDRGNHVIVRGRRNVMERMSLAATTATKDLILLATKEMPSRAPDLVKLFSDAKARGVRLRLLTHPEHATDARLEPLFAISEVRIPARIRDAPSDTSVGLVDGERAMLIHYVPDDDSRTNGQDIALLSDEQGSVRMLAYLLESLWETARPVADYQTEKQA